MNIELLERLCLTAGVPAREHRVRELILKEIKGLFDTVEVDPLGSIIAVRKPDKTTKAKKPTRIMLAAHMDQIGFLVRFIDDNGFIRVQPVGGFDPRNLFARQVRIAVDVNDPKKDIPGVLNPGGKPVHIASEEDKKKIPTTDEFVIDTGLPAEEVKKRVRIGDMVTLVSPFERVGETVVSQALDNRVACWVVIEAMRALKKSKAKLCCEVHAVFTVQEEVGLRGALSSAYTVEPDIGIGIDVTLAVDTPGVETHQRCSVLGGGAALTVMDSASIADLSLYEQVEQAAQKAKIPMQRSLLSRGGTDTGSIQRSRSGARTMTLSCPTRYIHTVTEMVHTRDLSACRDVVVCWLKTV
jgi:endoglucanase